MGVLELGPKPRRTAKPQEIPMAIPCHPRRRHIKFYMGPVLVPSSIQRHPTFRIGSRRLKTVVGNGRPSQPKSLLRPCRLAASPPYVTPSVFVQWKPIRCCSITTTLSFQLMRHSFALTMRMTLANTSFYRPYLHQLLPSASSW